MHILKWLRKKLAHKKSTDQQVGRQYSHTHSIGQSLVPVRNAEDASCSIVDELIELELTCAIFDSPVNSSVDYGADSDCSPDSDDYSDSSNDSCSSDD